MDKEVMSRAGIEKLKSSPVTVQAPGFWGAPLTPHFCSMDGYVIMNFEVLMLAATGMARR